MIGGEISIAILVFNLDQFQEKLITRFFKNKPKKTNNVFVQILAKMDIPFIYHCAKNQKKLTNSYDKHRADKRQTDKQSMVISLGPPSVGQYFNNQFGFDAGDSCVHQLLLLTHEIYKTFDANPSSEMSEVFLDLRKAFDIVWWEGPPKNREAKKKNAPKI